MVRHLSLDELNRSLPEIAQSPKDQGTLKAIVIRPVTDERVSLTQCDISPELGVHGDNWAKGCWLELPDGSPHPDVQIAMMNSRVIDLLAQDQERWPLAGDQLFVDLDLSDANLSPGQQLSIGSAMIEITAVPHKGCLKFVDRFGTDSVKFVNSDEGKKLRLRGIYAKIVKAGTIHVGDELKKMS